VRQGKSREARISLRTVYGFKNEAFYTAEVLRMETENERETSTHGSLAEGSYKFLGIDVSTEAECFNRTNLKRTSTAVFAASGQQMIGATFVIGYATYFLELIGVKDYFDASIVLYVVMLLSSMLAFPLSEIVGRRTMIVKSSVFSVLRTFPNRYFGMHPRPRESKLGYCCPHIYLGDRISAFHWSLRLRVGFGNCYSSPAKYYSRSHYHHQRVVGAHYAVHNPIHGMNTRTLSIHVNVSKSATLTMHLSAKQINTDAGHLGGKVGFIFLGTGSIAAIGGWYLYPETKVRRDHFGRETVRL
jgi:hypothetical protein